MKKLLCKKEILIGILFCLIIYFAIKNYNIKEGYRRRGDSKSKVKKFFEKGGKKMQNTIEFMFAQPFIMYKNIKKKIKKG